MSATIVVEADAVLAEDWSKTFFQSRPTDSRYESVKYQSFYPVSTLTNASNITFVMPRFSGPNCYLPHDMLLEVEVVLTDEDGKTVVPASKQVAPINNILHSLFRTCRVYLNDCLITKAPENYAFKAYMIDVLSFSTDAKFSWLQGQGFYRDNFMMPITGNNINNGWEDRQKLFRNQADTAYTLEPVTFKGRLHTDLGSCYTGILPGIGIKIELGLSSHDFVLHTTPNETAKMKLLIDKAALHIPVATLSKEMYTSIETKLDKTPASMYMRRSEVTNKNIPGNSQNYCENLFQGSNLPCKIILTLLPTTSYLGSKSTSPFEFQRNLAVYSSAFEEDYDDDFERVPAEEGASGRKRKRSLFTRESTPAPPPVDEEVACLYFICIYTHKNKYLFFIFQTQTEGTVGATPAASDLFIESINLTLNGESLDGLDSTATYATDVGNFVRLHTVLGNMNTRGGNELALQEFNRGYFFACYDLTTSNQSSMAWMIPAVRQGNLAVQIKFSKNTTIEYTLLIYAEYSTLIKVTKKRQISMSY